MKRFVYIIRKEGVILHVFTQWRIVYQVRMKEQCPAFRFKCFYTRLRLSNTMFTWEVNGNMDSLTHLFDSKLSIVNSRGEIQNKAQFLSTLSSGNFEHDSIDVEQSVAIVKNNTATVIGKGRFAMTLNGNKLHRHLSYTEVFIKEEKQRKLLAWYASVLPD